MHLLNQVVISPNMVSYLMIFSYSLSFPFDSFHLLYITDASTLAGLEVFGSLRSETTDRRMVRIFCVGFHRSQGSSPLCGSSTGGWRIEIHRSPFWKKKNMTDLIKPEEKPWDNILVRGFKDDSYHIRIQTYVYLVNVGMKHFGLKPNCWWRIGIVMRKPHVSLRQI